MSDELGIIACVLVLVGFLVYGGFWGGRHYEQQFWTKYYEAEMEKTCLECAGITKDFQIQRTDSGDSYRIYGNQQP